MKTLITIVATAAMTALAGGKATAQTETQTTTRPAVRSEAQAPTGVAQLDRLKVRVTGIGEDGGTVMVAMGNFTDVSRMALAMVPALDAEEGAVECTLRGEIDLDATLYVFLDANGNYNLDLGKKGIPAEKCAYGPVVLDENGTATIELKYYNN